MCRFSAFRIATMMLVSVPQDQTDDGYVGVYGASGGPWTRCLPTTRCLGPTIPHTVIRFEKAGEGPRGRVHRGCGVQPELQPEAKSGRPAPAESAKFVPVRGTQTADREVSWERLNNLFSVGAGVRPDQRRAHQAPDTGLFTGEMSKANLKIVFGPNFDIGSEATEKAEVGARKLASPGSASKRPQTTSGGKAGARTSGESRSW